MWQTQEKQIFLSVSGWTALMERTRWESVCIDNLIILNLILVIKAGKIRGSVL
jgi:hypothetical protein